MSLENSTIAALATASGVASISIVRVSGTDAYAIAQKMLNKPLKPRYATLSFINDSSGDAIDQAIVIYFQSPNSFTGEDIVEFQCHGGMAVAQAVLETTLHFGAQLAKPGEFSKRAFLNGKIDISKAEAIAKLIESKSQDAAKILTSQLKGELQQFVDDSKQMLLKALAYSEVSIDYADEDLPSDLKQNLYLQLQDLSRHFQNIVASSNRRKGLIEGFKVCIIGKPNVGKSSLLNTLLSYNRAIVSDIAGTTRDTIEEQVYIGTHLVRIVDTAGIRDSKQSIEKIGIEKSLEAINQSDIIVALFDGSQPLQEDDHKILNLLQNSDKPKYVAINKSDLDQKIELQALQEFNPISISTQQNCDALLDPIKKHLDKMGLDEEIMLTSSRQIAAVTSAQKEIKNALEPLQNEELELFSYHLVSATQHLSAITDPYDSEEVLDKMFGEFCLGK